MKRLPRAWPLLPTLAILLAPSVALAAADGGEPAKTVDARALERQLDEEHAALSTADCNAACRALLSIRRAADKICVLEPGPRCEAARAKVADATRRVREACPDCVVPGEPVPQAEPAATGAKDTPKAAEVEAVRGGGCRSCASTGEDGSHGELALLVLGVLVGLRRIGRRPT